MYPFKSFDLRWSKLSFFLVVILLIIFPLVSPSISGRDVRVIEVDDYEKNVEMDGMTRFNWTVYNSNVSSEYSVRVTVQGFGEWEKSLSESNFILDEDTRHGTVSLRVSVPSFPQVEERSGQVTFTFEQLDGDEVYEETRTATVAIEGMLPKEDANTIVGGFSNPLPGHLDNQYGALGLNILIWAAISLVFYFLISPVIHKLTKRTKTNLDDIMVTMIRKPATFLLFLYGLIHSILRVDIGLEIRATAYQIYSLILVVIAVYVTYHIFDAFLAEIAKAREGPAFNQILIPIFEKLGAIVILVGGLVIGLRTIGIEVTALLAGAGILGLVIAFAAQDTLSNFFSGIHLLLDRPFTIGDLILLESGEYCRIQDIGMRSTKLYNLRDHESIVLPNNSMANQKIVNIAQPDTTLRVPIKVGVAYGSDLGKVKKILYEVAENHPDVIDDEKHETTVRFNEFAESSLNFTLRVWVDDIFKQWDVGSELRQEIDRRFHEEGITIPFPQRTLWMHEVD
ncbi:MAG: mechanosensitive ion channel family protein [Candidatus Saliniplasma sp.]